MVLRLAPFMGSLGVKCGVESFVMQKFAHRCGQFCGFLIANVDMNWSSLCMQNSLEPVLAFK